jgi:DNA/RNA-binding domain of Phe-tRNA-synthetase-like protein
VEVLEDGACLSGDGGWLERAERLGQVWGSSPHEPTIPPLGCVHPAKRAFSRALYRTEDTRSCLMTAQISIDAELKRKCPKAALAFVTAEVETGDTPPELTAELSAFTEKLLKLPEPKAVLESAPILATRSAYKALGKDPARYRGSAEALLRRVISRKGLPQINSVVDVINLISVESRLPVGLYDSAHIQGDIVFRAGRAGETYKGIGKYDLNLEGLPLFADALGPHGSPTSDSERTMVTPATKQVLAIIISFGGSQGFAKWPETMCAHLEKFAQARNHHILLSE